MNSLQSQIYVILLVLVEVWSAPAFQDRFNRAAETSNLVDSQIECHRSTMTVRLKLAEPFHGYIYPADRFNDCVLFTGSGETNIVLKLNKNLCGTNFSSAKASMVFSPIIEHELMIQWDRDLVEGTDTRLIAHCGHGDQLQTLTASVNVL